MASVVRGVRFDDELFERISKVADSERRSFANAVVWLVELGLEEYERSRETPK